MISIPIRSFETRIVVFFVVLLTTVQVAAYLIVSAANDASAKRELAGYIHTGERLLAQALEQNNRQLTQASAVLAADSRFHDAIATRDPATILSVLTKNGAGINPDLVMLADPDHKLLVNTLQANRKDQFFPYAGLIAIAQKAGQASAVVIIDQQPYHLVVAPIPSSSPIAWIAQGFRIDKQLALKMQALTSLQVTFLSELSDRRWIVSASTLPQTTHDSLPSHIDELLRAQATEIVLTVGEEEYGTRTITLTNSGGERVVAVLQESTQTALEPFSQMRQTLIDLAIASIFASLFGSIVISRRLAHPINKLAEIARRTRNGDYSRTADTDQDDEIGDLASSINHMRNAITAREKKILRLAYQDTLTSLPNRALFNDRLDLAIKAAERDRVPVTLMTLDLDRFKHINDTLGHPFGDRVLQAVGERLQSLLRKSDTIARLGGDEFAIILPKAGIDHAGEVADKILAALDAPIVIDTQPLDVRTSIGIASYPEHGADPYTIVRHADVAMYIAKRGNLGSAVFQPDSHQPHQDYLTLLGELRRAVEQDELVLYYQPKVDLNTGVTAQAEALVRWNHPQRGLIPPVKFIPFAEQTGYIRTMTRWIIRRAIRQCGEWQARGIHIAISVNICARDLIDPSLCDLVSTELKLHNVDARWLCMEITENGVMEDPAKSLDTLRQLSQLGIKLAIDDYGTGYSSLSYVKKLPVTELKIDQSFVRNMSTDADDAMIVKSTIDLGHNMGMQVVAEGVEDLAIWALLREMGCDCAQGYCMSKPLPAEQFEIWLTANAVFGDPTIPPARLAWRQAVTTMPASNAASRGLISDQKALA